MKLISIRNSTNMFKTAIISTLIWCFFLMSANTLAQSNDSLIITGQRYSIQSKILNEKRHYSVYLPNSYKNSPDKKYIVAYVLVSF